MSIQHKHISVGALVPYPPDTTPSQRFRIEQWIPSLEAQGISVSLLPFADEDLMHLLYQPGRLAAKAAAMINAGLRRALDVISASRCDVVLVHRGICLFGPAWLERLLSILRCPMIFDFDDAIFMLHTSDANRRLGWLKFPGKTAAICRLSQHVVVGSDYLAEYARQFNPRVALIPTSIDTEQYKPRTKNDRDHPVMIGWTGSATSQAHLEMFAPVLRELVSRRDVQICVQSNREPVLPGVPHTWRPWSPEAEVEELRRFDIGIKPMPDDPWARGKCPMKEIQYMALGIPVVCSAVGSSRELIEHGKNGLLAATNEEWLSCLERLIDDRELRYRIGEAGRQTVEERFSKHRSADLFAHVVRETCNEWQSRHGVKV